jgi:hypothetical protein
VRACACARAADVTDELTLFRAYGGYEKGITVSDITESMMISQLANVGATNFCAEKVDISAWQSH